MDKEYLISNGNIALVDADLLDKGTRHPNLVIMKLSGYFKDRNNVVTLIEDYDELTMFDYVNIDSYDAIFISKVFDFTKIDKRLLEFNNVFYGGTGFYFDKAPPLPEVIEHYRPDYHVYDSFIKHNPHEKNKKYWKDYQEFSIGFATRGCFRKCPFCVNQKYNRVFFHSHVSEWLDESRPYIYLWDDNILGYSHWREVFDELMATNKPFQFKQGMDLRILTPEKAEVLSKCKYWDFITFAFDNIEDKPIIEKKLKLWREYSHKNTRLYVLTGYAGIGVEEVESVLERIRVIMEYGCVPYIMRHENYVNSKYKDLFTQIARWCNQVSFFKKKSFREFCLFNQQFKQKEGTCKTLQVMEDFEKEHPEIAKRYFDLKFEETEYYKNYKKQRKMKKDGKTK